MVVTSPPTDPRFPQSPLPRCRHGQGKPQHHVPGQSAYVAAQGATVAVNDIEADRWHAVVDAISSAGGRAVAAPFDVTEPEAVISAMEELPPIDILVNNAGNGGTRAVVIGTSDRSIYRARPDSEEYLQSSRNRGPLANWLLSERSEYLGTGTFV